MFFPSSPVSPNSLLLFYQNYFLWFLLWLFWVCYIFIFCIFYVFPYAVLLFAFFLKQPDFNICQIKVEGFLRSALFSVIMLMPSIILSLYRCVCVCSWPQKSTITSFIFIKTNYVMMWWERVFLGKLWAEGVQRSKTTTYNVCFRQPCMLTLQ